MSKTKTEAEEEEYGEYPWRDKELMEELYLERGLSQSQIAEKLDCSQGTVGKWLREEHEIPTRSMSEGSLLRLGTLNKAAYYTNHWGHEHWSVCEDGEKVVVYVHRLVAVAEWGFDAVCGMDVHHKNTIEWDNRVENLELLTPSDHAVEHRTKIRGEERREVADLYEETERSSRDIAEEFGVTNGTVLAIHKEFYGEDS